MSRTEVEETHEGCCQTRGGGPNARWVLSDTLFEDGDVAGGEDGGRARPNDRSPPQGRNQAKARTGPAAELPGEGPGSAPRAARPRRRQERWRVPAGLPRCARSILTPPRRAEPEKLPVGGVARQHEGTTSPPVARDRVRGASSVDVRILAPEGGGGQARRRRRMGGGSVGAPGAGFWRRR